VGCGGRWCGGRERRGEGGGAKQGGREHAEKGERWELGREGGVESPPVPLGRGGNMNEGRGGRGGRVMKRHPA